MDIFNVFESVAKPTETMPMAFKDENGVWQDKECEAPLFIRDNQIICCGGHNGSSLFMDYYGEYRGGISFVSEKLEQWARENFGESAFWEWENPECLCLNF